MTQEWATSASARARKRSFAELQRQWPTTLGEMSATSLVAQRRKEGTRLLLADGTDGLPLAPLRVRWLRILAPPRTCLGPTPSTVKS